MSNIKTSYTISDLAQLAELTYKQTGKESAVSVIEELLQENSDQATPCFQIGTALVSKKSYEIADYFLTKAITIWKAQKNKLNFSEEKSSNELDIKISNGYVNLGSNFQFKGEIEYAVKCYKMAYNINPKCSNALNNMGAVLVEQKLYNQALEHFIKAVEIDPEKFEYYLSIANLYAALEMYENAIKYTKESLKLERGDLKSHINLAILYYKSGDTNKAYDYIENLINSGIKISKEELFQIKVKMAFLVPYMCYDKIHIEQIREKLLEDLDRLLKEKITLPLDRIQDLDVCNALFYITYHGLCNKDIKIRIANFMREVIPDLEYTSLHCNNINKENKKLRIGFVSQYIMQHAVSLCCNGIMEKIGNQQQFETFIFSSSMIQDEAFNNLLKSVTYVNIPSNITKARDIISSYELDVLCYLDIGMNSLTYALAFARLAPTQCVVAGHPDTTGIDNIDFFVSAKILEPENAEQHYSEKLIKLDNAFVYYKKPDIPQNFLSRKELGITEEKHVYFCPMLLHKIHPDFDYVIGEILRQDARSSIAFVKNNQNERHLKLIERFKKTIPDVYERIEFIPFIEDITYFLSLLKNVDALLDTLHFSGGTTLYLSMAIGAPIVTLPGEFMRSRSAYYMYKKMAIDDLIAKDANDYINIALRLARDKEFYNSMQQQILAKNNILYDNNGIIEDFSGFLKSCRK